MKLTHQHTNPRFQVLRAFRPARAPVGCAFLLFAFSLMLAPASQADEGMWLFNNPPLKLLQEKYHFQPRLRGSSTCRNPRCDSITADPARLFPRTDW